MTTCISNTRQINLGLRMYADDQGDAIRDEQTQALTRCRGQRLQVVMIV